MHPTLTIHEKCAITGLQCSIYAKLNPPNIYDSAFLMKDEINLWFKLKNTCMYWIPDLSDDEICIDISTVTLTVWQIAYIILS